QPAGWAFSPPHALASSCARRAGSARRARRAGTRRRTAKDQPLSEHITSTALRRRRSIALAAILVAGVLALALGVRATRGDRVLPGVRVDGVALGGATRDEVRERLKAIVARIAAARLTLVAESRRETITPRDAGYFVDLDATADRALESG